MQLMKLAALLPALALVSSATIPEGLKSMYDTKGSASGVKDSEKDGTFQLNILGADQYRGELGEHVMGHYGGQVDIPAVQQIIRLKPTEGGVVPQEQTCGVVLALKSKLDTAIIECSLTTTGNVPESNGGVIFNVTDSANPKGTAGPGPFKDVVCKAVSIPFAFGGQVI